MVTDFTILRNKAKELRQAGSYSEAAEAYRQLWFKSDEKDIWDGWGLTYCYNKLREYDKAYTIGKEVYNIDYEFDFIISQLSQAAFMANIKYFPDDGDGAEIARNVTEVLNITTGKFDDLFRIQSLLRIMEFSAKNNYWEKVLEWAENLNSDDLSSQEFRGKTSKGQSYVKPSDKESYYLKVSKALVKLGRYQECIKKCDKGLSSFSDSVWLMWHKGESLSKLGMQDEAIEILDKVCLRKSEWYILKDLSAAYYRKSEYEKALNVFLDASLGSVRIPKPENRWELYFLGGKIYQKLAKEDYADKHFSLAVKLREDNDWKIKDSLKTEIESRNLNLDASVSEQLESLTAFWRNEKETMLPQREGMVKNFIANGKAGFIVIDEGENIYFSLGNHNNNESLDVGDKVKFRMQKSFDKSKNKESTEAVFVTKIS